MEALIICAPDSRGRVEQVRVCGAPFLQMALPEKGAFAALLARRGAARVQKMGVCRAAFSEGFPYRELFEQKGIAAPDPLQLRLAAAAQLAEYVLREKGVPPARATAALSVVRANETVWRSCVRLARHARFLLLSIEEGGEELARQLRFTYGVAAALSPTQQQLASADVHLCFDPRQMLPGALALYDAQLPIDYRLPEDGLAVKSEELLSLLLQAGAVRAEKVRVLRIASADP